MATTVTPNRISLDCIDYSVSIPATDLVGSAVIPTNDKSALLLDVRVAAATNIVVTDTSSTNTLTAAAITANGVNVIQPFRSDSVTLTITGNTGLTTIRVKAFNP